jgi:hypothetical protein
LAKVSKPSFEEIISKYPQLTQKFKDKIYHYNDNVKLFLEKIIDSVSYFRYLSTQAKHEILYKFKKLNLEKGGFLYRMNDIATRLYAIQSGFVEVTHSVEGESFVIEKLHRGSVINHRSFLLADDNDTDGKCGSTVSVFYLEYEDLDAIRQRNAELDNEIKKIEN